MKMTRYLVGLIGMILWLTACDRGPKSGVGFRLPDGDPEKGQAAFVSLKCHTCHMVVGVDLPAPPSPGQINFPLGGDVTRLKTYGDLVTSIINPAHGLAPGFDKSKMGDEKISPMPEFNQVMTVEQMINLVAFLQPRYKKLEPGPYSYLPP